ncbi:ATP-binding sensor histidine kinase [Argonema antarcticum]|uniref:ATP-binding sensor histidine kinase n=1 Tax=Argonema antarcticum TaxID=2942763 RepID=UPI0020121F9C|nr:ATP-binding sensor histidine kinase [Argonema antarcticum]MCL1470952.1 AAA family ATPase [Argonema antarcticum A004/B2]
MLNLTGIAVTAKIYDSPNSEVYRGILQKDNQPVILKVLKQDYPTPEEIRRYKQEYEIACNLNIDGTIKAYGLQNYQNTLVIIFEDFGGESLKILMDSRKFNLAEFLAISIAIADSLGHIHTANIIHKDINPSNIVFHPETGQLKIIDFGISTVLTRENPTLKNPNILEGTLAYISPEQTGRMNRFLDYRTDFYSLGVTFYELLTGQLPFATIDPLELVHCHIAKQPICPHQLNPDIPKALSDIVMKMMAKTAEERYQSAWGIKADLEKCLTQLQRHGNISDLTLGTQDISDKFLIPQKLYGREAEVKDLLAAFDRVASPQDKPVVEIAKYKIQNPKSKIEMMLIAGYSGIGKSSLVAEIYKPITEKRGYFISGKFDQFQRNIPYSAVVVALEGLVKQLLTESEAQVNQWRDKLLAAFGQQGRVIIDVIPEVELIVGKQPDVPELRPQESQNRFNLVFQNFIRAFGSKAHPLVIFLDDLQWADGASLKLIELMMTDANTKYLFFIGAYRDNEVNASHPLLLMLDELQNKGKNVNFITLNPLDVEHISHLIADTLHSDPNSVKPLAELVVRKTLGNPFFVNEFLKTLYAENLLAFDCEHHVWQWDIAEIEAKGITDNVVELIIGKLQKLPESTQEVLRLAACVGAFFDLNTLSIICEKSPSEIFSDLVTAVKSGFILPTSELDDRLLIQNYKFLHDRVQQAAYALIDKKQKKAVHLQIGRLLLRNTTPEALSENIFAIVDHLNLGVVETLNLTSMHISRAEKDEIARLNAIAGKKAKAATAYGAASRYFNLGRELLAEDSWQTQYNMTLALYELAAEAAYLSGDFEQMETLVEVVLQQAKTLLDRVKVYEVKIQAYQVKARLLEVLKIGLQVLKLLGINLTEQPSLSDIQRKLEQTISNLNGRQIDRLIHLPKMTDPDKLAAMRILARIVPAAYMVAPPMFTLIVCEEVNLSIKYGNAPWSSYAYATYGAILCGVVFDIKSGYQFGKLALNVLSIFNDNSLKAMTFEAVAGHIYHWKESVASTLIYLELGYQVGLETGEFEWAGYCAIVNFQNSYFIGKDLNELVKDTAKYSRDIGQIRQKMDVFHQSVLNLNYETKSPSVLIGEVYNEEQLLPEFLAANDRLSLNYLYLNKLILSYLFYDYFQAVENATKAAEYLDGVVGMLAVPVFHFYDSLARLGLYASAEKSEQQALIEQVIANQEKMQKWAHYAPMNHLQKFYLVEAERHRVLGQYVEALEMYDRAIAEAKQNEYINEEALANELAAKFYLSWGKDKIAQVYMTDAYYCYSRWGATAKVKHLESNYPQLLRRIGAAKRISDGGTITSSISTGIQSASVLDLATVMKASQAISGEMVLDKLLAKLMKILIENAGAQVGYLILHSQAEEGEQLLIQASGAVDSDIIVLQSIPIDNSLPVSIINYVVRTNEAVVLNNAMSEGNFTNDSYIKKHQTKSILCATLMNQGQLSGIVYLENNLIAGAFTPDRLEVLQLLSGQAAIAIANAKLYAEVRESKSRLNQYLEAMPVGIFVADAAGKPCYVNQTAQQMLGKGVVPHATDDELTKVYQAYLAGSDRLFPYERTVIMQALKGERATIDDMEIHQENKIIPLEVWGTPIYDAEGNVAYALAAFQDITERKQAEKLLAEYNRNLEIQVAERTQELSQTLEHLQATQEELIQSEKMAALGQLVAGVAHEINTPLGAIRSSVENIAEFMTLYLEKLPAFFQQLSPQRQQDFFALLQNSTRQVTTFSSKEKRAFKRALVSQLSDREITNADTIADTLVDLGIYENIEPFLPLLKDPKSEDILNNLYQLASLQKSTQIITTATNRAAKIVFALKSYARYDNSGDKLKANIIEGIETVLTIYESQLKHGVETIRNYDRALPSILCYPDELNQVWTNLIHNALQAMSNKGSLTIDARQQDTNLLIGITDSGTGIDPKIMSRIFDPFFTTKPPGEGSGLGLNIVKKIIDKHEGNISVESMPGQTTFTVSLPIK